MFAGLLNKGFRGSLALIISLFAIFALISTLASLAIEQEYYPNLFYNYFTRFVSSRLAITGLNYLFIGLGLLLVGLISVNQEIVDKQNYFPVFLYLLLGAACASPLQVSSQSLTNVFVLYSVYRLLDIYRQEVVLGQIFAASFWLSVSAFITISSIISFPLFFVALLILRPFHWREWVIALIGFACPIFFYECLAYLSNFNQWYLADAVSLYFDAMRAPSFSEYYLPLLISLFILLVISILHSMMNGFGNTVKKQRTKTILLWYLFFSLFGVFSGGANTSTILLTYAFPLCFFIGDFLFALKQTKISNTLLMVLLLCTILVFLGEYQIL
jgi:hypothetical protein